MLIEVDVCFYCHFYVGKKDLTYLIWKTSKSVIFFMRDHSGFCLVFKYISNNSFIIYSNQVPLEDDSIDVAVFCLSLMGTNLADFLVEANRTLKLK